MASKKGATYLDKLCHKFYDHPKGHGEKTDYVCRLCGGPLETYYCEERLYLVQCADCATFTLVKTANPEDAARVTLARPTITPPNEWVSVEDTKNLMNCLKCHHRNPENGNCVAVGGFCTAVPAAYCPLIPELLARCTRLEEAREHANEACAKWEARAERAEKERDAAISDLETAMAYGIESNCLLCKNDQCYVRGGGKPCLPKWRGIQGELAWNG